MANERQNTTNNLLRAIETRLPSLDAAALPPTVHHYTDASGLDGILKTGTIWATDYRYLNDSSELRYIFDLARKRLDERTSHQHITSLELAFLTCATTESPPYDEVHYYLCCFSEAENALSQWRAYGGRQGFCITVPGDITFREGHEEVAARQGQTAGTTLLKVNYDVSEHGEYVETLIENMVQLCRSEPMSAYEDAKEALRQIMPFFWGQLERVSYRFKHPDFSEEKEWRLVSWGKEDEHFRTGGTLTPYARFRLHSTKHPGGGARLPILAVRHGPTTLPSETRSALDRLLNARGYDRGFCARLASDTPARIH